MCLLGTSIPSGRDFSFPVHQHSKNLDEHLEREPQLH